MHEDCQGSLLPKYSYTREKRSLIGSLVSRGDVMFFWHLPANVETLVGSFRVFGWDHTFQWFGQAAEL